MRVGKFEVREIGAPILRKVAAPVENPRSRAALAEGARLKRALKAFRARYGFGRAIAAPQIGISKRMVAMDLGKGPFLLINPEFTWVSRRKFSMWDDCMSFPGLMVRLRRHVSVSVRYVDEKGRRHHRQRVNRALSELLQHEIDHLDGVLAVDGAHGRKSVISRGEYVRGREWFDAKLDYAIAATIRPPELRKAPDGKRRGTGRKRR